MTPDVIRRLFAQLVEQAGGVEAAASAIEARTGTGNKGTVSKMATGRIGVTMVAVMTLEDFCGVRVISRSLAARENIGQGLGGNIRELAAQSMICAGAAHAALMRAMSETSDGGADLTGREASEILAEMARLKVIVGDVEAAVRQSIGGDE
jgi:hypothetical protein